MSDPNTPEDDALPANGARVASLMGTAAQQWHLSYDDADSSLSPAPGSPVPNCFNNNRVFSSNYHNNNNNNNNSVSSSHSAFSTSAAASPSGAAAAGGGGGGGGASSNAHFIGSCSWPATASFAAAAASASPARSGATPPTTPAPASPRLLSSFSLITTLLSTVDPAVKDKLISWFLPVMMNTMPTNSNHIMNTKYQLQNRSAAAFFWEISPEQLYHDAAARRQKIKEQFIGDLAHHGDDEEEEDGERGDASASFSPGGGGGAGGGGTAQYNAVHHGRIFPLTHRSLSTEVHAASDGNTRTTMMMMRNRETDNNHNDNDNDGDDEDFHEMMQHLRTTTGSSAAISDDNDGDDDNNENSSSGHGQRRYQKSRLPPLLPHSIRHLFTKHEAETLCCARDVLKALRFHELPPLPDAAYEILTLPTRPNDSQVTAVRRFVTPQLVQRLINIQFTAPWLPFSTTDVAMSALDYLSSASSQSPQRQQERGTGAATYNNNNNNDDDDGDEDEKKDTRPDDEVDEGTRRKLFLRKKIHQEKKQQQEKEERERELHRRHVMLMLDRAAAQSQTYLFALWCRVLTRIANVNRPLLDRDDVRDAMTRNASMLVCCGDAAYFCMRLINHIVGDIETVQARFCDAAMVKLAVHTVPPFLSTSDGVEWWSAGIALLCGKNPARADLFVTSAMAAALVQTAVHTNSDAAAKYWMKCLYRILNGGNRPNVVEMVTSSAERLADAMCTRVLSRITTVGTTKQAAKLLCRLMEKAPQLQWTLGSRVVVRDILCALVRTATDMETAANLSKAFSLLVSRSNEVRGFFLLGEGGSKVLAALSQLARVLVLTAEEAQREAAAKRGRETGESSSSSSLLLPASAAAASLSATKAEDGLASDWLNTLLFLSQWRNPQLTDSVFASSFNNSNFVTPSGNGTSNLALLRKTLSNPPTSPPMLAPHRSLFEASPLVGGAASHWPAAASDGAGGTVSLATSVAVVAVAGGGGGGRGTAAESPGAQTASCLALLSRIAFRRETNANLWIRVVYNLSRGPPSAISQFATPELMAIIVDKPLPAQASGSSTLMWEACKNRLRAAAAQCAYSAAAAPAAAAAAAASATPVALPATASTAVSDVSRVPKGGAASGSRNPQNQQQQQQPPKKQQQQPAEQQQRQQCYHADPSSNLPVSDSAPASSSGAAAAAAASSSSRKQRYNKKRKNSGGNFPSLDVHKADDDDDDDEHN